MTPPACKRKPRAFTSARRLDLASPYGFSMGKGRFVNQKLGKRVSRKFDLLKSELAGPTNRKASSHLPKPFPPKQETSGGKP